MQIPVLIESLPGDGYRARGGEPFAMIGEGATPEAALAKLRECVSAKLSNGARLALIEIQSGEHPWLAFAGMYDAGDPLVQEWLDVMRQGTITADR